MLEDFGQLWTFQSGRYERPRQVGPGRFERGEGSIVMRQKLLLATMAASYCFQGGSAQDFGERVEDIVAYMTHKAEKCIGPTLDGEEPFKVCRGEVDTISLTIS